jgi:multiple antibiotic resistance protein
MAGVASAAACAILLFFSVTGDVVLRFFGISLPAFQLAGGFIFFVYALQMLQLFPGGLKSTEEEEQEGIAKENVALVPLATPLIAGPGAITAVLVWQHSGTVHRGWTLMAAVVLSCAVVYAVLLFGERIARFMGIGGIRVVTRLMGLLLAVIAVQFMVDGFQQLR